MCMKRNLILSTLNSWKYWPIAKKEDVMFKFIKNEPEMMSDDWLQQDNKAAFGQPCTKAGPKKLLTKIYLQKS